MRLKWNPGMSYFEAEFQDFQTDLDAVKAAGFKTTGSPDWIWHTQKIGPLDKLRKNRPASGLTILEDALVEYKRIKAQEESKAALLAELKAAKKAIKKKVEPEAQEPLAEGEYFKSFCVPDSEPTIYIGHIAPPYTGPQCVVCKGPVYFFELQSPPTCMWCEIQLDNSEELF